MTRRFLFSACIALFSMCAISLSSCSSDDDESNEEPEVVIVSPTISAKINGTAQKNNSSLNILTEGEANNVKLSFDIQKGTGEISSVTLSYTNSELFGNLIVTDLTGNVCYNLGKNTNEIEFAGVYAKYTLTVKDSYGSVGTYTFSLTGDGLDYNTYAASRLITPKQSIAINANLKQFGLDVTPKKITASATTNAFFKTTGKLVRIQEATYNQFTQSGAKGFKKACIDSINAKIDNSDIYIKENAPLYYFYKYTKNTQDYLYLIKVAKLDEMAGSATLEIQY
ncbi:MAG TPA: hypothetical protein PLN63_02050 [Paludibacteraceae bacterium]|jgi:hypothetical protein|nr:hypothetical protein [Paludibacteraceae bacterium]HOU66992.1 hypothetical protein [Paludibacteraceae bacterium]HPH62394.1 hypothetical protein [Paludibacteraceae bacterium]HQF49195.1 hypothetical protein [Paludibacteraceae bacterium]HQJ89726.1 hypothetical protein [Paludibacteraceae bacterium]